MSAQTVERQAEQVVHNVTKDGRVMHFMRKVDGVWTCACGETRDRYGHPGG